MRVRAASSLVALAVLTALVTVPVSPAIADPAGVVVGPETLLDGSTGLRLTKEYETVAPTVPGLRSTADAAFVPGPVDTSSQDAHGGSSLQLFTGAGKPNPGTNPAVTNATLNGKEYVGRWFDPNTVATRLSSFSFRVLTPLAGAAPYLSVEFFNADPAVAHHYLNLVWTPGINGNPGVAPGQWQDFDTTTGWSTSAGWVPGITANQPVSLAAATAAIAADVNGLTLLRANVAWGDTSVNGGYANRSIYLDDISMTFDGAPTTYAFDAPYAATCAAPAGGWVTAAELSDATQWATHTEYQPTVPSTATAAISPGPSGAVGGASLVLASGAGTTAQGRGYAGKVFVDRTLPGCTVGDLTALSYRSFSASSQAGFAPYINIDVALPGDPTGGGSSSILVWSPGEASNPAPAADAWTTFSPFTGPGGWRVVRAIGGLVPGSYYTWAQVQGAIGGAEMPRGVSLVTGDSTFGGTWAGKTLQVDNLALGVDGAAPAVFDFGGPLSLCPSTSDASTQTITLTADCSTDQTVYVADGWTLDGAGHSIVGTETAGTSFHGAIVQNAGVLMHIRNLTVTTNKSVWDNPSKNSGGDLVGIRFLAAAGSLDRVTVDGVSHGNGVQEGKGVLVDNRTGAHNVQVTISGSTVVNYQKNGVDVRGAGATLELRDSTIGAGAGPQGTPVDAITAANSVVVAYGATAVIDGNHITGNDWDGTGDTTNTRDWNATGVLLYQAGASVISRNVIDGAGTDTAVDVADSVGTSTITCNVVTRSADEPGAPDVWSRGIWVDGSTASLAGNTVTGFRTPLTGAVDNRGGGCAPLAPTVAASVDGPRSATVLWGPGTVLAYAPVTSYEVSVDGVSQTHAATDTSLALTGLLPHSTHSVAVRSVNSDGPGPWTSTAFTTSSIPVPAAVSGVIASAISTTSASVSWSADPTVGDGVVDGYEVAVSGAGTSVVPAGTLASALSGLTPGASYTVTLRAHNESGWSNPVSVSFTTNDLDRRTPGAPTLTVGVPDSAGTVPLSWTPNTSDSVDFPVTGWIVAVDGTDEASLPAGTRAYDVVALRAGRHTVTVRGVNALGSAAFAAQVFLLLDPQNAPPPTAELTASSSTIVYGSRTTLRGSFALNGTGATDTVVTLWALSGSTWINVGTTVTGAGGGFTFVVAPGRTTTYRAVATGFPSAYRTVAVRAKVATALSSTVRGKKTTVKLAVTVSPRLAGTVVRLQRLVGTTWRTTSSKRLSPRSTVVFTLGTWNGWTGKYRIAVPATSTLVANVSSAVTVKVRRR